MKLFRPILKELDTGKIYGSEFVFENKQAIDEWFKEKVEKESDYYRKSFGLDIDSPSFRTILLGLEVVDI